MTSVPHTTSAGGPRALRLLYVLAVAIGVLGSPAATAADDGPGAPVTVTRGDAAFVVEAQFVVRQTPQEVLAVLTDYAGIPRFLPDIRRSLVRSRSGRRAIVEQEAVSGVMMFSRKVHLVLEIDEAADAILFRDTCGRSFEVYQGGWRVMRAGDATLVRYDLRAKPAFSVPEFLLVRLFKRDSRETIERITREIARRARSAASATR